MSLNIDGFQMDDIWDPERPHITLLNSFASFGRIAQANAQRIQHNTITGQINAITSALRLDGLHSISYAISTLPSV